jgi:inhibitor of KinA
MFQLKPLGDQALLAYLDSEADAQAFAHAVRELNPKWLVDVVPAYASVAVFYDLKQTEHDEISEYLTSVLVARSPHPPIAGKFHQIPCCYEMGPDLTRVAHHCQLKDEDVVRLHTATVYILYAIGFCPGFPYLGYLPAELAGVPRLPTPRLRVEPGGIGVTGRQTGIYPEARPGGWNLVGRSPLELVDVKDGYFPLRTGDRVQFVRIDEREFGELAGQRL